MRKCFSRMSVIAAVMLVLIVLPFMRVRAGEDESTLPDIPDVKITDGVLSWGEMEDYSYATVTVEGLSIIQRVNKPKLQFDLFDAIAQKGSSSGSYKVTLVIYGSKDGSNSKISKTWEGYYQYTCSGPKCAAVTDIVWDESQKKITWKSSPLGEGEEYKITMKGSSCVHTCTEPELPLCKILSNGTNDYQITVCVHKYGCPDGDPATVTKSGYTYVLKSMKLSMDSRGVFSWEKVPYADGYKLSWKAKDGSGGRSWDLKPDRTYYDVEAAVISSNCCGKEIDVTIQAYTYFGTSPIREITYLTSKTKYSYVSMTQSYPLKYFSYDLNSHNISEYEDIFRYDPDTNTIIFDELDLSDNIYSGEVSLFYSSEPLTVKGIANIYYPKNAFKCDSTLTFEKDSDIVIHTTEDRVAVSADKIVFNGRNIVVKAVKGTAVQAKNGITFESLFGEGRFISGSGESAVSVTSSQGKINLGKESITLPEGGNLGTDSRNIYMSDKATVASRVTIQSSLYAGILYGIPINETNFPSKGFREYLSEKYVDRNMDKYLDMTERMMTRSISMTAVYGREYDFASLKGIEYFTELETLRVSGFSMKGVDLSNNPNLMYLELIFSQVDYLDISKNPALIKAYKFGKKSTSMDPYTGNVINTYIYTEDLNDEESKLLVGYLEVDAKTKIDTVGPVMPADMTVEIGKSAQCIVKNVPASDITWSVGNAAVATVDASGNVTGKSFGNTYLYAKLSSGKMYKCLVRVVYPPLSVRYSEKTLHINQTFQFAATGACGQKVTWSVGNTDVATVDANGKVTAKKAANTYLYATSADGRVAKCLIKVVDPGVLGINYTEKTVYWEQSFTFTAKNAGILPVTWSVGNTAIAKVDSNGKVTAVSVGNTYLYAKTADGRSARCLIKVVAQGPLNIRYTEKTIKVGASFQFTATNTAGQKVSWKVGNTAVATVDANGNVTGKKAANTWLYASTPDGREVKCLIKVVA